MNVNVNNLPLNKSFSRRLLLGCVNVLLVVVVIDELEAVVLAVVVVLMILVMVLEVQTSLHLTVASLR